MSKTEGFIPAITEITLKDSSKLRLKKFKLTVERGEPQGTYIFNQDMITIGVIKDNDLVLQDPTVSRLHCRIYRDKEGYLIKDIHSTNGTFVNGTRVREAYLNEGDTIRLGHTELTFFPIEEEIEILPSKSTQMGELIGTSVKLREIFSILEKVAPTDLPVLIEGETGTGKEVVARTIYKLSLRRQNPFMIFDCSAVAPSLIESELFGHERGAFTGATTARKGIFELAHKGTIFLDEICELSREMQPKLLRILEQRELKRLGANDFIKVNVRIIAATNRNITEEVRQGRFREDLYYRISVIKITLPPLRERKEDIPLLAKHFLKKSQNRVKIKDISPQAMECLMQYHWPGNLRQLSNVINQAVSLCKGDSIKIKDLPPYLFKSKDIYYDSLAANELSFKEAKRQRITSFERTYILDVLRRNNMNISRASRQAGLDRKYFKKLMRKYNILIPDKE